MEWYVSMGIGVLIGAAAATLITNYFHSAKYKSLHDRVTAVEQAIKKV
jgi:hypothetical protein